MTRKESVKKRDEFERDETSLGVSRRRDELLFSYQRKLRRQCKKELMTIMVQRASTASKTEGCKVEESEIKATGKRG